MNKKTRDEIIKYMRENWIVIPIFCEDKDYKLVATTLSFHLWKLKKEFKNLLKTIKQELFK